MLSVAGQTGRLRNALLGEVVLQGHLALQPPQVRDSHEIASDAARHSVKKERSRSRSRDE
jgi:hypothetical protein